MYFKSANIQMKVRFCRVFILELEEIASGRRPTSFLVTGKCVPFFFQVSWLLNNPNVYFRTILRPPQHCRRYCTPIYNVPKLHITLLCPNTPLRTNVRISILGRNVTGCRIFPQCVISGLLCRNSSWLKELFILSLALKRRLRSSTHCSKFLSKGRVHDSNESIR